MDFQRIKNASKKLANFTGQNEILLKLAKELIKNTDKILAANKIDLSKMPALANKIPTQDQDKVDNPEDMYHEVY